MLSSSRNQRGLSGSEIEHCRAIWDYLRGNDICPIDVSEASEHGSRTRFNQVRGIVYLGADVQPSINSTEARVKMSEMACLAHELAHAERWLRYKIDRPTTKPDVLLDEAEASIHGSFQHLSSNDRQNLIEDAKIQIAAWQEHTATSGANYAN